MKLRNLGFLLALFSVTAQAAFNPHNDTIQLGNKTSTNAKTIIFDIDDGSSNPQISCSDSTGLLTFTSGTTGATQSFTLPASSATSGYVLTATGSATTAWQATTSVLPGSGLMWMGPICPSGYLLENGSAVSRTTYSALFAASSISTTGTTNATTTITGISSTTGMAVGMAITGSGIPTAATIATIASGTSITISSAATTSVSSDPIIVYAYGPGDGSTTFNIANLQAAYPRGAGSQTIGGTAYSAAFGSSLHDSTAVNGLHDTGHTHGEIVGTNNGSNNAPLNGWNGSTATGSSTQTGTGYANLAGDSETRPATVVVTFCVKY